MTSQRLSDDVHVTRKRRNVQRLPRVQDRLASGVIVRVEVRQSEGGKAADAAKGIRY